MPPIFHLAWLIPFFPVLFFVLIVLFAHRNRALSQQLATYGIVISFGLALWQFLSVMITLGEGKPLPEPTPVDWFSLGNSTFSLGVYIDPVNTVMLSALALVCSMLFAYGKETMQDNPGSSRFFTVVSLLVASTLGLLIFDNLLISFSCWGIIDLCTYLLIGIQRERKSAFEAAL